MAPLDDDATDDLLECGICSDLIFEPVTLGCCGKSFCRACLHKCLQQAKAEFTPQCPGGCGEKLPYRLPPNSKMLQHILAHFKPDELERRRGEAAEDAAREQEELPGGFTFFQEVAASRDLVINHAIVAAFGARGIVVCAGGEGRICVKFDAYTDGRESCIRVSPCEILPQLPVAMGFTIGQRVVAAHNLMFGSEVGVRFGVRGNITQRFGADRLTVQFDERTDGSRNCVNVLPREIRRHRIMPFGFELGQRVAAAKDLFAENVLLVRSGTHGVIRDEYGDTRLSVKFDERADGLDHMVNVTFQEIAQPHATLDIVAPSPIQLVLHNPVE